MSVSLCMQAFQEMGEGRKPSKNPALKSFTVFCSQGKRKGKNEQENNNLLSDRTSNAVYRGAGKAL